MIKQEAITTVLRAMESLGHKTPKPGKFVGDWRFVKDGGTDDLGVAEITLKVEDEIGFLLPPSFDCGVDTIGEMADRLVKVIERGFVG